MKTRDFLFIILFSILPLVVSCGDCDVILPNYVGDHMVIQRGKPFRLEGTAIGEDGSSLSSADIAIRWRGKTFRTVSDSFGRWSAVLPQTEAGGPFELKVGSRVLKDVMVGDVYLFSGQSNMELPVRRCLDATGDYVRGYSNQLIRYLGVPMKYCFEGGCEDIGQTEWQVLDSDSTALGWGAVGYFTARALVESQGVPVGIVNAAVGGSPVEAWMQESLLPSSSTSRLPVLRRKGYVDSVRVAAQRIYSDWQEKYNSLPQNETSAWEDVDMFSPSWALGPEGGVWYGGHLLRRKFNLSASQTDGDAILHLGAMRDADSTFVNGVFVGNTTYQYPPRNYRVPEGVLAPGENVVEIHLYATNNAAAFVPEKKYSLETDEDLISLEGVWSHRYCKRMEKRPAEIFLQYEPTGLYNGMIAPLKDMEFSGVVWYQGESNCGNAAEYGGLLSSMITDWRKELGNASLPFYIIELAAFEHSELTDNDFGWNRVQKEQRSLADDEEGIFVVENADLGEWNDIHPQDKRTVGERTAAKILYSKQLSL